MALIQTGPWHRAYQDPKGTTVYSEYDDGSVGTFGIRFADGTSQFTAASGAGSNTVQTISSNTTLTIAVNTNYLISATGGAGGITITLPAASTWAGQTVTIKKVDSGVGAVVVAGTIDGVSNYNLNQQWQYVTLKSDGSLILIVGNN